MKTRTLIHRSGGAGALLCRAAIGFLGSIWAGPLAGSQTMTPARADLDDDGSIGTLDVIAVFNTFGLRAGQHGFLEGLDLVPDGEINYDDISALFPFYYQSGVATSPTAVSGVVFDGFGAPLPGVEVTIGPGTNCLATTGPNGTYSIPIPAGMEGATSINFNGSTVGAADDPTPGVLSGQFPTIPNKPIFINGGTTNSFRAMSLPERDLTGSTALDGSNATSNGGNQFTLTQEIRYHNPAAAGAAMTIPSGLEIQFPPGEDPVFSVMKVDPAFSPAPLPPGGGTNVFVSFQPGGTTIAPSPGDSLTICFDNIDAFTNVYTGGALDLDHPDQPQLLGIEGGVFDQVATVLVTDAAGIPSAEGVAGPKLLALVDLTEGFTFAWYPVIQTPACPRTTLAGVVKDFQSNPLGDPVAGAIVSIPGYTPVSTDGAGQFLIPNVIAGPNGPRCFTNPFSLRASASIDLDGDGITEQGASEFAAGVPGGLTEVGCIPLRGQGTVQGRVLRLACLEPFTIEGLDGIELSLNSGGTIVTTTTNAVGCYRFTDVAVGSYTVSISDPSLEATAARGSRILNGTISSISEVDLHDFRLLGTGKTKVTVLDRSETPIPFTFVEIISLFEEDLGGGFVSPGLFESAFTDENGCTEVITGIPLGSYEVRSGFGGEAAGPLPPQPEVAVAPVIGKIVAAPSPRPAQAKAKTRDRALFGLQDPRVAWENSHRIKGLPQPGIVIPPNENSIFNVIACAGQCNDDVLRVTPPNFDECDLINITVESSQVDDPEVPGRSIAGLKFTLTFLAPFGPNENELNLTILMDTDGDATTGSDNFFNPVIQPTGIERELNCFFSPFAEQNCSMSAYSAAGQFEGSIFSSFLSSEQSALDPTQICIFVPNDPGEGEDLLGSTSARIYLLTDCFGRFVQFVSDAWPDSITPLPDPIDFLGPNPILDANDPAGDLTFDDFFE